MLAQSVCLLCGAQSREPTCSGLLSAPPWSPELCGVRLWTPGEPATGLQPSRCSEHVYGETGKEERKDLIKKCRTPRNPAAPFIRQRLPSFKEGRGPMWRVPQTHGPVNRAVVTAWRKCCFPAGPREAAVPQRRAGLTGTRHACSRAWIPGTANSIWPSLSASFLGKRMSFLLCGAWERPGSVLTGGEAGSSPAWDWGDPEIVWSWGFPPGPGENRAETQRHGA